MVGWFKQDAVLRVIFTEITQDSEMPVSELLRAKIQAALVGNLGIGMGANIDISLHAIPEIREMDQSAGETGQLSQWEKTCSSISSLRHSGLWIQMNRG